MKTLEQITDALVHYRACGCSLCVGRKQELTWVIEEAKKEGVVRIAARKQTRLLEWCFTG